MEDEVERAATLPGAGASVRSGVRVREGDGAPPPDGEGTLLELYELGDELGRGGMGLVVAARDTRLGRTVALKVLHEGLKQDPGVLRRFLVEAQVGAQLEHPNIVPVYGMEADGDAPAFTMRLLPGSTFKAYLDECRERLGAASEDHTLLARLEPFLKICDAVAYAHAEGVVHRDLKPANVVLGEHGEVYLVDWGVAKVVGGELAETAEDANEPLGLRATRPPTSGTESTAGVSVSVAGETVHGELVGTPTYMAPEQAEGRVDVHGPATDQYALGMMLQEIVTLARPRTGAVMEQVFAATRGERDPLEETAEGDPVPPGLAAIVARATARAMDGRYPSVEDFADDVRRFTRGEEVSVHPDGWTRKLWRRLSRRPEVAIGVVLGLVVIASLAATVSLARVVATQREASAQSARLARLTGAVVRRSEAIDASFARTRALVEGLAVATEELHVHSQPTAGPLRYGVAGRLVGERGPPLADLHLVDRYGEMEVSFTRPLYLYPPEVAFEDVEDTIRRMSPLVRHFRELLVRSHDDRARAWPLARQLAALDAGRPPLHVTYVGFESGLLLNYPGYEPFPEDYDPRRRPWYREARERWGVRFGHPYPDASGSAILVPCNRALRSRSGEVLGVAGADMALDDLARQMRIDLPGWRHSSMVDAEGRTLIDTEQAGMRLGVGLHGDEALEAPPVARPILDAIARDVTGWTRHDRDLIVFDRLEEIGWTLVVYLDPGAR